MQNKETFGSKFAIIAAMAGSAIGLGNIWRFPYVIGENGGAAFIIIYIAASLFLSIPIFIAEFTIGRRSGANCFGALNTLAPHKSWKFTGMLCIITPTIILSYYSVVGGWSIEYLFQALTLQFLNPSENVAGSFEAFIGAPAAPLVTFLIFLALTCLIVAGGLHKGIEKFSKIAIPVLFFLILGLAVYSFTIKGGAEGIRYLVSPDFSKLTPRSFANAIGQSFYSISLGMGIIITYSSYVSKDDNMFMSGLGTAGFDLIFALLAGFAIMPAVFAAGIGPGSGPGLIFDTLPFIFSDMCKSAPILGSIVGITFFLTVTIAALTSSVSLLEVPVAWMIEEKHVKRSSAIAIVFVIVAILGSASALAYGPLKNITISGYGIFDAVDIFCCNFLLPLGGLLCVIFVGWVMKKSDVEDEFTSGGKYGFNSRIFPFVYFLERFLAPLAIGIIVLANFF